MKQDLPPDYFTFSKTNKFSHLGNAMNLASLTISNIRGSSEEIKYVLQLAENKFIRVV